MATAGPNPSESKGFDLMAQAKKKAESFSLFNKSGKYEEAAELYAKAGAQFKIAKMWQEAGEAYKLAAEMSEKANNDIETTQYYTESAKAFKNSSMNDATKMYQIAIQRNMEANKFSSAAKLNKELAEMFEEELKSDDASKAYEAAAECYFAEDSKTSGNQMLLKVAEQAGRKEDYKRAIEIFERIAQASADNNLTRWSATDYLFKASLCQLALAAKSPPVDYTNAFTAIRRYRDENAIFASSREAKFMEKLEAPIMEKNIEKFTDVVFEFDSITKLDQWKSELLLHVKKSLSANEAEIFA